MEFASIVISLAATYMLIGAGYVVVYRASRVLNFAHGGLLMLGAYFALTLAVNLLPGRPIVVIIISIVLSFGLGLAVYRLLVQPMVGQPVFVPIIVTIALYMFFEGLTILIWGASYRHILPPLGMQNRPLDLPLGLVFATFDAIMIVSCIAFLGGLFLFYRFTRVGVQMRGASENVLLAAQRGINVYFLFAVAWGIAGAGAGLAGTIYAANTNLHPGMGFVGIKAFPAAMVGGLDSLLGLIPGAFIIALSEAVVLRYINPLLANVMPMIILLLVLIIRPWGLFGTVEEIERV